jgi:hypothetical protein
MTSLTRAHPVYSMDGYKGAKTASHHNEWACAPRGDLTLNELDRVERGESL